MSSVLSNALTIAMRSPVGPPKDGLYYTPVFRLAFPHLDEPWAGNAQSRDGGKPAKPAFSAIAVFNDDADLRQLVTETNKRLTDKFGANALEQVKYGTYRYALRPKAAMAARFAGFEGAGLFASLRAQQEARPACMTFQDGKAVLLQPGAIERHMYAGAFCYAAVSIYAYDNVGKGVSWGVRTLVKVADGERFGGPKATTQEEALAAITGIALPPGLVPGDVMPSVIEGSAEPGTSVQAPADDALPWGGPGIASGDSDTLMRELFGE